MLNCRLIESFLKIRTTEITWLTRSLVLFKRVSNISYFYSCILCASIYVPFKFVINEQTSVQFIIEYFYYHSIIQYRGEKFNTWEWCEWKKIRCEINTFTMIVHQWIRNTRFTVPRNLEWKQIFRFRRKSARTTRTCNSEDSWLLLKILARASIFALTTRLSR